MSGWIAYVCMQISKTDGFRNYWDVNPFGHHWTNWRKKSETPAKKYILFTFFSLYNVDAQIILLFSHFLHRPLTVVISFDQIYVYKELIVRAGCGRQIGIHTARTLNLNKTLRGKMMITLNKTRNYFLVLSWPFAYHRSIERTINR
jgi:hypothetical protein